MRTWTMGVLTAVMGGLFDRIDPRDYGMGGSGRGGGRAYERKPDLRPDVIGVNEAVLTIGDVRLGIVVRGVKRGVMEFSDYPSHSLWLSLACIQTLVKKYGPDTADWLGKPVPLVATVVDNPETGEEVSKFRVAHPLDWHDMIADAEAQRAALAAGSLSPGGEARPGDYVSTVQAEGDKTPPPARKRGR